MPKQPSHSFRLASVSLTITPTCSMRLIFIAAPNEVTGLVDALYHFVTAFPRDLRPAIIPAKPGIWQVAPGLPPARERRRFSRRFNLRRLIWDASSGTPHLGRLIWDASSGTHYLGRLWLL